MAKTLRPRRYWFVDLKWIFGLLAMGALALATLLFGLYRVTDRQLAVELMNPVLQGFSSLSAEEMPPGLVSLQQQAAQVGGMSELFYQEGMGPFVAIAPDRETQALIQTQYSFFSIFTAAAHGALVMPMIILGVIAVIGLALAVLFSARFGRLATAGVITWAVGLPGLAAMWALQSIFAPGIQLDPTLGPMVPRITAALTGGYIWLFWIGAVLLVGALVGKIIWMVLHRQTKTSQPKTG